MFIDCNESSWNVSLVVGGVRKFYSTRAALAVMAHEFRAEEKGEHKKAALLRKGRQMGN